MAAAPLIPSEDFYSLVHSVVSQLDGLKQNLVLAVHEHRAESLEVLHSLQSHLSEVAHLLPPPSTSSFQRFYTSKLVNSSLEVIDGAPLLVSAQAVPSGEISAPESFDTIKNGFKTMAASVHVSSYIEKLSKVQLGHWLFQIHQKFSASKKATSEAATFYSWLKQNELLPSSATSMEEVKSAELLYTLIATYPRLLFCHNASSQDLLKQRLELLQHFTDNPEDAAKFRSLSSEQQNVLFTIQNEQIQSSNNQHKLVAPLLRPIENDLLKKLSNVLRLEDMSIQTHFAAWAQDPSSASADPLSPRLELITEATVNPAAKSNNFPAPTGVHVQLINYVTAAQPPAPTKLQATTTPASAPVASPASATSGGLFGLSAPASQSLVEQLKAALANFKSSHSPAMLIPEEALKKQSSKAASAVVSAIGVPAQLATFLTAFQDAIASESAVSAKWKQIPASVQAGLVARTLHGLVRALENPTDALAHISPLSVQLQLFKVDSTSLKHFADALASALLPTEPDVSASLKTVLHHFIGVLSTTMEGADVQLLQGKSWKTFWATLANSSMDLHSGVSSSGKKIDLRKVMRIETWTKAAFPKVEPPTPYCLVLVPVSDSEDDDSGDSEDSAESVTAMTRFVSFKTEAEAKLWAERLLSRIEALAIKHMFGSSSTVKKSTSKADVKLTKKTSSSSSSTSTPKADKTSPPAEPKEKEEKKPAAPKPSTPVVAPGVKQSTHREAFAESSDSESSSSASASVSTSTSTTKKPSSKPSTPTNPNRLSTALPSRPSSTRMIAAGKVVEDVLLDDTLYVAFRRFLAERQAAENLLFYKAAHNFKQARKKGLKGNAARQRAEDVYDKFLSPSSDQQVTIAAKTLETAEALLWSDNDPPADIFMAAASEVSHLVLEALFHQFLPSFKQSPDAPQPK
eukprot:TRINITY_DN4629_c0_g1_i2.p1 TRINITY_DN4629_c0_g1~~TRINITY_DN4629_c0_g1_i2.p1  ORF type:complete len:916 (+),score=220.07 TRINITY_DN4629_c0_g1_i2:207-2954(+)